MDRAGALSKKAVMPYLTLMLISKAIRLSNLPPFQLMMPIAVVGRRKKMSTTQLGMFGHTNSTTGAISSKAWG